MAEATLFVMCYERFVEDHLCQAHMEEENVYLDEGLGDFLREADLQLSAYFLPIAQNGEPCSHIVFGDDSGQDLSFYGQLAKYARIVIERWSFT